MAWETVRFGALHHGSLPNLTQSAWVAWGAAPIAGRAAPGRLELLITQREFSARMIRPIHARLRRFATALAVMAALALVLNGALGSNHHLSAAAGHDHAEAHSHGTHAHSHSHAASIADHQSAHVDVLHDVDVAAADIDGALAFSPDADACDYLNACSAAVVLPCPSTHALPFLLFGTLNAAPPRYHQGVIPDGLRRPPRPLAIT